MRQENKLNEIITVVKEILEFNEKNRKGQGLKI